MRLDRLCLFSPESRGDGMEIYKVMKGMDKVDSSDSHRRVFTN